MTDKEYVIRICQMKKFELIKPTKQCPGVLVYDRSSGFGWCAVDAKTWKEAKEQINKWCHDKAQK